jgi:hypothetical protein
MDTLTDRMGGRVTARMTARMIVRLRDRTERKGNTQLSLLRLTCCV